MDQIIGLVLSLVLQIFIAIYYSHFLEWLIHIFLHNRKALKKVFKYHFSTHHGNARRNEMVDHNYKNFLNKNAIFEPLGLLFLSFLHFPIFFFFPIAYIVLVISMLMYYYKHRKAHLDIEWGKKKMPWHYEHHMGKDQNKNWGVRSNIFDIIFKTNTEYNSLNK